MMQFQRARTRMPLLCAGVFSLVLCVLALGQAPAAGPAPNSDEQIMNHLNRVLRWAQQWESTTIYLSRPGDEFYLHNGRQLAQQVTNLEFQSALAQAALLGASSKQQAAGGNSSAAAANIHNIFQAQQRINQELHTLQSRLDAVTAQLATASAKTRPSLIAQRDTLQGQVQLAQALQQNLEKLTSFMTSAENSSVGATALTSKILALERANPLAAMADKTKIAGKAAASHPPTMASNTQNPGLIGQVGQLIHFVQSLRTLKNLKDEAAELQSATQQFRAPLLAALRATLKEGQIQLSEAEPASSGNGPAPTPAAAGTKKPATAGSNASASAATTLAQTPAQQQQATRDLLARFKLLSRATLPLSQELILIDQSQANLNQLQASIQTDYYASLRRLLLKVVSILIALGLIWLFSELWRRAAFRYIREARRRRQFLVLRRVVTGFFMVIVIVLGFISDFSSLATYAGLITAGVAVALQAIILSIAAYFFLVGRYGVRVGDRVTVNNVAGDVIDIGLVRFYMMELGGSGIDVQPTGRICVFPNSVLFQTNPLYKQLPGAEYVWREVGLPLSADSDPATAEKELLATVTRVFDTYHERLEVQQSSIEGTMGVSMKPPHPYTRRRFVATGIEVMARYPVPLRQAGEMDDRMVTEVSDLLRKNPSIKLAASAAPEIRTPVKV